MMEAANEMDEHTTYALLEPCSTGWQARILESGKEPYVFESPIALRSLLCKALNSAYSDVVVVSAELFERKVGEREASKLFLEADPTLP